MTQCLCGCGGEVNNRFKKGHNLRGEHRSEETRKKISFARRGKTPMLGKHHSNETKQKMSDNCFMKGKFGKDNPSWKGGRKFWIARMHHKRRQFGFIPLNSPLIDGWVAHHIDLNYVIYIPEELHKSIVHSVTKDRNMDLINDKVYEWFMDYYFKHGVK